MRRDMRREKFILREDSPLLGHHERRKQTGPWRKALATICVIVSLVAASLLVIDPGRVQSASQHWLNSSRLRSGQQPQQPQDPDYKKWLQSTLDSDYKSLPENLRPSGKEPLKHQNHHRQAGQEQNTSMILESVAKLLDSVGKNFLPSSNVLDTIKTLIQVSNMTNMSPKSTFGMLKAIQKEESKKIKPASISDPSQIDKLQSELDMLKIKLYQSIGRSEDKRVEADMAQIIDQMREQGCPLYGVFSLLNLLTEVMVEDNSAIDGSMSGSMSNDFKHYSFQAAMKRRLAHKLKENRDRDRSRDREAMSTTMKPILKKFYGLPPQSIMDAYIPKSIADTFKKEQEKEKEEQKKEEEKQKKEAEKEKKEKDEEKKKQLEKMTDSSQSRDGQSPPILKSSIAKDWGSFGQKIQEEFEEINRKHMMDQLGDETTPSVSTTTDHE